MSAIGPFKVAGVAAGMAVVMAGITVGLFLGRKMPSTAGANNAPGPAIAFKLAGYLFIIGGVGGTFLSLMWDVIRRGKSFSAGAIGPLKMMGATAGIVLMVIGIVMVFFLARKRHTAPKQKEEQAQTTTGGAQPTIQGGTSSGEAQPVALAQAAAGAMQPPSPWQPQAAYAPQPEAAISAEGYQAGAYGAADPSQMSSDYPQFPPREGQELLQGGQLPQEGQQSIQSGQLLQDALEEVPFALPIEEANPPQSGAEPLEAIPIEEPPRGERYPPAQ